METETEKKPVDLTRRRLAKGGLAAPVVLATLASRNALAAVPYQCTISGQMSGNASPNGPADSTPCNTLGYSGSYWSATLSNNGQTLGARKLADLSLTSAYDTDHTTGQNFFIIAHDSSSSTQPSTLYEILNYGAGSPAPPNLDYAKKALVLYLNAEALNGSGSGQYPLTTVEAGAMFNAIVASAGYSGTTSLGPFSWSNDQLKSYIDSLYH
jgi:hypothetical protein